MNEMIVTTPTTDNLTDMVLPKGANEALEALYVLDDMRQESHEKNDSIRKAANELLAETEDPQDRETIASMRNNDIEGLGSELTHRLEYIRKRMKDIGLTALHDAADEYVNRSDDENKRQAQKNALAYLALLGSGVRDIPFAIVDTLVENAGTMHEVPKVFETDDTIERRTDFGGQEALTGVVPVMNGLLDEEGVWTVYKRYTDANNGDHPGDSIRVPLNDKDPKRSVEIGPDGKPVKVIYHETTEIDPLASNGDVIDRIKQGSKAGRIAVEATGVDMPNIINKFNPQHEKHRGLPDILVGKTQ